MPFSRIYYQRASQPQGPTSINLGNPLSNGLVFAATPEAIEPRAVNGPLGRAYNTSGNGVAASYNGTNQYSTASAALNSDSVTILFLGASDVVGGGANRTLVAVNSAGTHRHVLYVDSVASLRLFTQGGSTFGQTGTYTVSAGDMAVWGARASPTRREVWRNGVLQTSETTNVGSITGLNSVNVGADVVSGTPAGYLNGRRVFALVWNRWLSDEEFREARRNPWQVFQSAERPIWMPASLGVNGSLTATLGALTSSATGSLSVNGSLSQTLGALTSSATGSLSVNGSLSATLGALSLSATGVSSGSASTGSLDATLGALTSTATGSLSINGSLSATLGALTLVAYENAPNRAAGGYDDEKPRRKYVQKIGNKLVVFSTPTAAIRALDSAKAEIEPEEAPEEVKEERIQQVFESKAEAVVDLQEAKAKAKAVQAHKELMAALHQKRYEDVLAMIAAIEAQEDEEEIELLLAAV